MISIGKKVKYYLSSVFTEQFFVQDLIANLHLHHVKIFLSAATAFHKRYIVHENDVQFEIA